MAKAEAFDKAWKMAIRNDFSLFDEIVHPEYESVNQGVKICLLYTSDAADE